MQGGNASRDLLCQIRVKKRNLDTGASITRNISGPGVYTFAEDGTVTLYASGTWLFVTVPGGPSPGYINSGREVDEISPQGEITVLKQVGTQEDVCATLS